jgi:uracil-DNA glycosylase
MVQCADRFGAVPGAAGDAAGPRPEPRLDRHFDPGCRRCPRLAAHLAQVRALYPSYHAAPVAPFGDPGARLLIVGLAPGLHGANASGRPFTGDHAGILLYATLHRFGLADREVSLARDDGLVLSDCRITNAVKCLPPENKPTSREVRTCSAFLAAELGDLAHGSGVVALGQIAHGAVLSALGLAAGACAFAHGACHDLSGGRWMVDSYHCSRYNTQTRRLTEPMFHRVFELALARLGRAKGQGPSAGE